MQEKERREERGESREQRYKEQRLVNREVGEVFLSFYLSIHYLSLCKSVYSPTPLTTHLPIFTRLCYFYYQTCSMYLLIYLSVYLFICLSVYLSLCIFVSLSLYISVYLSVCLSDSLSLCLSVSLSICLSAHLSIHFLKYLRYLLYKLKTLFPVQLHITKTDTSEH